VVSRSLMMVNLELLGKICYGIVDEVCPLITHQYSWTPKASYYVLEQKVWSSFYVAIRN
jgi:hypothetical protein